MAVRLKDRIEANIRQSDKVNNSLSIQLNSGTATVYDGSSAKTVNITPAAINAATSTHTHGLLTNSLSKLIANTTENSGWSMIVEGYNKSGYMLHSLRTQSSAPEWILGNYASGIAYGGGDTKGVISSAYNSPIIRFAGGSGTTPVWWMGLRGATNTVYNLNTGTNVRAATADALTTARTFSIADNDGTNIGPTVAFDGSTNTIINLPSIIKSSISGTASGNLPHFFVTSGTEIAKIPKEATSGWYHMTFGDATILPTSNHGSVLIENDVGTPYQIFFPDVSLYAYKRWSVSGAWDTWQKMSAGYADSAGSCSGNAATATTATKANQLTTARSIALGGQFSGSTSFNGTANVTINGELKKASINGGNTNTYPYRRFAYATPGTGQFSDHYGVFLITKNCENNLFGIIKVSHRTNGSGTACSCSATWLIRSGIAEDAVTIASWGTSGTDNVYFDVYYKADAAWPRTTITALGPCNMTLCDTSEAENAASTTYAYTSVAAGGTTLHNQAYTITKASTQTPIYGAVWN